MVPHRVPHVGAALAAIASDWKHRGQSRYHISVEARVGIEPAYAALQAAA